MKYKIIRKERLTDNIPIWYEETIDEANTMKEAEELVKYYYANDDYVWNDYEIRERNK